jgi:hypothetical protein
MDVQVDRASASGHVEVTQADGGVALGRRCASALGPVYLAPDDELGQAIVVQSIEGRRTDVIFDTSGGQVPSTSASAIMVKSFPEIEQYQLVQDGAAAYRLKVVQGDVSYGKAEIVAELRKWLGADAQVAVEFVPSIPRLVSGKHRPVICEYQPESAVASDGS